jgi:hypothetical protein
MEFEFDKFVKDLEKREVTIKEKKNIAKHIIEEDERRRLRSELYHERWQNRIQWGNSNDN